MHPKSQFFLGAILGVTIGAGLVTSTMPAHEHVDDRDQPAPLVTAADSVRTTADPVDGRIAQLESENAKLARQVQKYMKIAEEAEAATVALRRNLAAEDGADENDADIQSAMKASMEHQREGKILKLKTRLNLTGEQEAQLRVKLEAADRRVLDAASKAEVGEAGEPDAESDVRTLLTPEQRAVFAQMKIEENQANARLVASSELAQMQNMVGLTEDQQEKAFNLLYQQSQALMTNSAAEGVAGGVFDPWQSDLKGILSDQQWELYRKLQQQQLQSAPPLFLPVDPPVPK
jgi:hypothetical protein